MAFDYETLRVALAKEPLPAMVVDLDALDRNIAHLRGLIEPAGKKLRLATKSVRVASLIRYILEKGGPAFRGLMTYSAREALYLAGEGFDDFLIAYPTVAPHDLEAVEELHALGKRATLMVDSPAHLRVLLALSVPIRVCIDADMSYRPFGLHLGVRRSPVRTLQDFEKLAKLVVGSGKLKLVGVMGYEAQIAGLTDKNPFARVRNPVARLLKRLSARDVARKREAIALWCERNKVELELFNGGGTGSVQSTSKEPWITEVTAGSGFLQSHLFDYYASNGSVPAFCFALPVTRVPEPGVVTCQSGGFIASGETGPDKAPIPFLPSGMKSLKDEGFGEVQTPLRMPPRRTLAPGDPVFLRPAKAGEIAERFTHYLLLRGGAIVDRVPTYRGAGYCFY